MPPTSPSQSSNSAIALRPLTRADIPFGLRLSTLAGWNQVAADWQMLLDASSGGCFVALYNEVAVGTVTTVTYRHRFSWIGMVLVDPAFRRRGIGTALLRAAIDYARPLGAVRLDATPMGKRLYDALGFRDEYRLVRVQRPATAPPVTAEPSCEPATDAILPAIIAFDTPIFRAERATILRSLLHRAPQYAWVIRKQGKVTGYCLGRSGRELEQIGPIVAQNQESARSLLLAALSTTTGLDVIMDVPRAQTEWLAFLSTLGFSAQRPFIRMCLGQLSSPGSPMRQFAIAGPEVG